MKTFFMSLLIIFPTPYTIDFHAKWWCKFLSCGSCGSLVVSLEASSPQILLIVQTTATSLTFFFLSWFWNWKTMSLFSFFSLLSSDLVISFFVLLSFHSVLHVFLYLMTFFNLIFSAISILSWFLFDSLFPPSDLLPILLSTISLHWEINFPNSSRDSKFRFWNVGLGLCILPSFFQLMKEMENRDFSLAEAALPNIYEFTKEFEKWDFWGTPTFIFCQMVRTVYQCNMWHRRGGVNFWLNCQFSGKNVYIVIIGNNYVSV